MEKERKYATQREYAREKFVDPTLVDTKAGNSSALLGPSLDKFEKIRIKVGLVLVAICDKTEYTN